MKQKSIRGVRRGKKPPVRDKADQKLWHHYQVTARNRTPVIRMGQPLDDRDDDRAGRDW